MLLDEVLPEYEFSERHEKQISARPERAKEALRALGMGDLRLTRALLLMRLIPRLVRGTAPPLGADRPAMEFLDDYGFVELGETEDEVAYGVIDRFWRPTTDPVRFDGRDDFISFAKPGFAKAAFNFLFLPTDGGTRVVTETRIHGVDEEAQRKFRRYWLLIRAGSGLTRRDLLSAVRRKAERENA